MKVSVVLPTYNERENIVDLIERLSNVFAHLNLDYEIVIVDDNSPDGTADVIREHCSLVHRPIKLLVRVNEKGLATAIRAGIHNATGDVIVLMDADFSHDPDDVRRLVILSPEHDIINGSRYLKGGGFEVRTVGRVTSFLINHFLRFVLGFRTTDNTMGFLAIKQSLLTRLDMDAIFHSYGDFHFRLMYYALRDGATVAEVPVVYKPRRSGKAKTRLLRDGWGYVVSALKLRWTAKS